MTQAVAPAAFPCPRSDSAPDLVAVHSAALGASLAHTHRGAAWLTIGLLFLSALPDAMVVPLLNELFVTRYGVSSVAAHWFMSVNLLGAVLAIALLAPLRRRLSPAAGIALAAGANALLLSAMYLPIGFGATIAVRTFEGMADLIVFAMLFDAAARLGPVRHQGRRLGLAGAILMLGLFAGALIGGALGDGGAPRIFLVSAGAMTLVALAALCGAKALSAVAPRISRSNASSQRSATSRTAAPDEPSAPGAPGAPGIRTESPTLRRLWPPLAMAFSDRAVAGLMTATLPLFFASAQTPSERGWLIGIPLLIMALLACPAGWIGDRIGHRRLRTGAALLYAGGIAALPLASPYGFGASMLVMILIGLAGAALLPAALALTAQSGGSTPAMGAYRIAGDTGYLLGIAAAAMLLWSIGGANPGTMHFSAVILIFAAFHALVTCVTHGCACSPVHPSSVPRTDAEFVPRS